MIGVGMPIDALDGALYTGTTSATANETVPSKVVLPDRYRSAYDVWVATKGEGVYLEGADFKRDGLNFPTAKTALAATTLNEGHLVRLTDSLYVAVYHAANNTMSAIAFTVSGTTITAGSAVVVNNGDTDSLALCRINDTTFCTAYNDEVGDDYLCFRTGTVSGTTITMGTEKATAIAPTEDEIAITYNAVSSCVVAAYADDSDGLSAVAVPWDSTNDLGTVGTAVVLDAGAGPTETTICTMHGSYCVAVYADATEDSGKVHGIVFTVSSAGAISGAGTEKTIVDAAGTLLKAVEVADGCVAIGYVDASSDPSVIVITTSGTTGTTITAGTAVAIAAATATDVSIDMFSGEQGVCVWCDDAHGSDVGYACAFTLSGTGLRTVTADSVVDKFIDASAKGGTLQKMGVCCQKQGRKVVVLFNDANNDPAVLAGQYYEDGIVDIRSAAASATYRALLLPFYKNTHAAVSV